MGAVYIEQVTSSFVRAETSSLVCDAQTGSALVEEAATWPEQPAPRPPTEKQYVRVQADP
jgi:hypothetical protein